MPSVCFYFQVHQPERLRHYRALDIGCSHDYFDAAKNREIVRKVAAKCYLPMGELLLRLIDRHGGRFKVAFSISGVALDQFEEHSPETLAMFQRLAATGCVELLAETAFHSLAFVFDRDEFDHQVAQHEARVKEIFGVRPAVFRNTELIFNNELARHLQARGFAAVLAEGVDRILDWRSPNFPYTSVSAPELPLLLKNYRLSDDIAFRFSNREWEGYPLTAPKLARWIDHVNGSGQVVNLFMDYETFGEHQWAETGIFEFMERLPAEVLAHPDNDFKTPSEVAAAYPPAGAIDMHDFTSWADLERDLSAWLGNAMQQAAARALYGLRDAVYGAADRALLRDWQRLTTSDHLYYMCTKWFSDGDVHKYFNPYESPYEAYIAFMNVLNDLALRVGAGAGTSAPRIVEEPHRLTGSRLGSAAVLHQPS
jgi:alpha-amylase